MTLLDALLYWEPAKDTREISSLSSPGHQPGSLNMPSSCPDEKPHSRDTVILRSRLTGGLVYLACHPCSLRSLLSAGVPRASIWTHSEMRDVIGVPAVGNRLEVLAARLLSAQIVGRE